MLAVGDLVSVKSPFQEAFPDQYLVSEVIQNGDGSTVYILGDCGGFDEIYLEKISGDIGG